MRVIIPENHWVENWTSPAIDALGERHEETKIFREPDPGNLAAMMRTGKGIWVKLTDWQADDNGTIDPLSPRRGQLTTDYQTGSFFEVRS